MKNKDIIKYDISPTLNDNMKDVFLGALKKCEQNNTEIFSISILPIGNNPEEYNGKYQVSINDHELIKTVPF